MKAIRTLISGGLIYELEIGPVPQRVLYSMRELREYLQKLAGDCWGSKQGRDYRIAQDTKGSLIPIYAVNPNTGETITIA